MNKVSIYGGLGNQMFQYALCVALNHRGKKTRISFSDFLYYYPHYGFNLGRAFKIKLPFPLNLLNFFLLNCELMYKNKFAVYFLRRFITWYHRNLFTTYREKKEFEYDGNVFHQQSSFLVGIWQVESYFKDIKDIINQEFIFKTPKDKKNRELMEKIVNCNSVSIHIRRGDYLSINYERLAIIKDAIYYKNALDYLEKELKDPHFFIFSDDIQWANENLKLSNCTYVDSNKGKNSYIDMYLMSLCKHNIIANSTFSWWGAWLNKNLDKIVIMPRRWINKDTSPGIFPDEWVKLTILSEPSEMLRLNKKYPSNSK